MSHLRAAFTLTAAILAAAPSAWAAADSAQFRISDPKMTIVDLAPEDGISPEVWMGRSTTRAQLEDHAGSVPLVTEVAGFMTPVSLALSDGQQASSSAWLLDGQGEGFASNAYSTLGTWAEFRLAPFTQVTFSLRVQGVVESVLGSNMVGAGLGWSYETSPGLHRHAYDSLDALALATVCDLEGCVERPEKRSFDQVLSLTINAGAAGIQSAYLIWDVTAYSWNPNSFTNPVPEPASALLLLVGFVAIGIRQRRG